MYKGFNYRIYPTKEQREYFEKCFGASRFCYNHLLEYMQKKYEEEEYTCSRFDLINESTRLRQNNEWMQEVDSLIMQTTATDLHRAFQNFFKKRASYPKFKSKKNHYQTYRTKAVGSNIKILPTMIKLPKMDWVKTINKLPFEGKIKEVTITKTPSNKYFVSVISDIIAPEPLPLTGKICTLEFNLEEEAFLINNEKISIPNFLRENLDKMARLQQELQICDPETRDYERCRIRLAKLHEKITNCRTDFIQKLSLNLIREYDLIHIKDFSVSKELASHDKDENKVYVEAAWRKMITCLTYKAEWYGKEIEMEE